MKSNNYFEIEYLKKLQKDIFTDKEQHFSEQELQNISNKCKSGEYKFAPYNLKLISKGRDKIPREISIPSSKDKLVLKALDKALRAEHPIKHKTHIANYIISDIVRILNEFENEIKILRLDIKDFFDEINHIILLNKLNNLQYDSKLINLIENAIKTPTKEKFEKNSNLNKNKKGVPQGLSIANYLADLYLDDFIEYMSENYSIYRYVDDICVIYKEDQNNPECLIKEYFRVLQLQYHQTGDKYSNKLIEYGFDFLGYQIKKSNSIIVSIRDQNKQKFVNSIIATITKYKKGYYNTRYNDYSLAKQVFEFDLNEKITGAVKDKKRYGWLFYFHQINDLKLLDHIDGIISNELNKIKKENETFEVKRLKRAYYEIKNNSYILDYGMNDIEKIQKYFSFLIPALKKENISKEQIIEEFNSYTNKRLKKLKLDQFIDTY